MKNCFLCSGCFKAKQKERGFVQFPDGKAFIQRLGLKKMQVASVWHWVLLIVSYLEEISFRIIEVVYS